MDENDLTQEEMTVLHRMLREEKRKRQRTTQERAAMLTKALQAQYGPLYRPLE